MDKNSVYKTDGFYWNIKRNDFFEAFISEEKCRNTTKHNEIYDTGKS